jgi:replicative DNA helicase
MMKKSEFGKIPPQAIEIESAVLGALFVDSKAIYLTDPILDPEAFYHEKHQLIYKAARHIHNLGSGVDSLTVANELTRMNVIEKVGGAHYLIELSMKVASSAHVEHHAKIIQEKYVMRSLISEFSRAIEQGYDDATDVGQLLDDAGNKVYKLTQAYHRRKERTFADIVQTVVDEAEAIGQGEIKSYLPTPLEPLTTITGGFRPGKVYILAARPGMGKTAFAGQCLAAASVHCPALFVSLEMTEEDIARRLFTVVSDELSSLVMYTTGIKTERDRTNVTNAAEKLKAMNIHLNAEFSTMAGLKTLIKTKVRADGVGFVVVDYLQLITPDSKHGTREQEISSISRELKKLSLELKIPILVLSQLSRKCEERTNRRPILSDLRDSGAIEQDADAVMFLYRDSVYTGNDSDDSAEIIVAKSRNGSLGFVDARFIGRRMVYVSDEIKPSARPAERMPYADDDDDDF